MKYPKKTRLLKLNYCYLFYNHLGGEEEEQGMKRA